ncbi:MAG: (Fe-S)-binding protein [Calditrichota bacterium]
MANKSPFPEMASRREELSQCVNCGLCQSVCPTYRTDGYEGLTARGKIVLMKGLLDGSLKPSEAIADLFDDCLSCYACQTVCPAGVRTERLWTAARQDLARWSSAAGKKRRALRWTIGRPRLLNLTTRLTSAIFGFNPRRRDRVDVFSRRIPIFRGAPLQRKISGEYRPEGGRSTGTVGLLIGCSSNFITPDIAEATVQVLTAAGIRVVVPTDQVCCGAPAINNGDWNLARRLAVRNLEVFADLAADYVTSPDATCAQALKRDYLELFPENHKRHTAARDLARMTMDLGHLLARLAGEGRLKFNRIERKVTLHDSCHATHIGGGSRWREVLKLIPGLELVEMQDPAICCGFGGSYALFHEKSSNLIAARKIEHILETGVSQVLTTSPGCALKLQSAAIRGVHRELRFKHAVEVVGEASKKVSK